MAAQEPSLIIDPGSTIIPVTQSLSRGPLVKRARVKWERDPEMSDLIDYFDDPRFHSKKIKSDCDRFELLSLKEIKIIQDIVQKCRADFSYAARNFFWITNKKRGEQLFKLWESQELIYGHLLGLKAKGLMMKLICMKARQLGCSTLIEGLIAWKTMFFKNVNAIVVSFDAEHAAYLFGIMQYIYDRMPWFLKPQCSAREYKDGLKFENPDQDDRRRNPGLNSAVMVQAANKRTGVGQGLRISAAHASEFADWHPDYARDVIEEDLGNALAEDDPDMFAILESTAKGAGNYSYRLWNKNVELAEQAEWHPLFLPWFFERTRFIAPPSGWRSEPPEISMNDRVQIDWLRCDNADCEQYQERYRKTEDKDGTICPTCGTGTLNIYSLKPGQMYWMQRKRKNAEKEAESLKKLRQELATTSEESFQLSGTSVFGEGSQEWVNSLVRPPLREGFLDKNGKFHGPNPKDMRRNSQTNEYYEACYLDGCEQDHGYGDENGETPYHIWKDPEKDAEYSIGADVSEGLGGEFDYSVGFVIKVNKHGGADEHVATFRSNRIDPVAFAQVLNFIGRWYNDALMSIEVNRYDTCMSWIRFQLQYPNLYRWKHMDSINPLSNKLGWLTNVSSKPRLYQTLKRWLQFKLLLIYSRNFASEMKTFTKDEDERGASSESGAFDDEIMSCVPAGTLVATNYGQKPIEAIRIGDMVLTHRGRFMPVTATMVRPETKSLYRISAYGRPALYLTSDHRIYLWEKYRQHRHEKKQVCWNKYRNPSWISVDDADGNIKRYGTCSVAPSEVVDFDVLDIASYIPDDYELYGNENGIGFRKKGAGKRGGLARMVSVKRHIPVDKDFLRMLGYYLAEGGYGSHNVSFASHSRENAIREWLISYLKSIGLHPGIQESSANGIVVWCSSLVIRSLFKQFGCKDYKKLPNWTNLLPPEKQREILIGYLLGDGCFRRKAGGIQAATISAQAAFQIFNMSIRCGWPVTLRPSPGQNGYHEQWKIEYSSHVAVEIKKHIEPEMLEEKRPLSRLREQKSDRVRLHEGYVIGHITKVEEIPFSGDVYDITVAEDHSFVANGTVVSNCMIALYCAHEGDWDDSLGQMNVKRELTMDESPWHMECISCELKWPTRSNHEDKQCPRCKSMMISGKPNRDSSNTGFQADAFEDGRIGKDDAQEYSVSVNKPAPESEDAKYEYELL